MSFFFPSEVNIEYENLNVKSRENEYIYVNYYWDRFMLTILANIE